MTAEQSSIPVKVLEQFFKVSFHKTDFRGNGVVWLWEGSGRRQLSGGLAPSLSISWNLWVTVKTTAQSGD